MLYYPQLITGTVSQYPIARQNKRRTVVNLLDDGTNIRMADEGAAAVAWNLTYAHLTAAEFGALQQFFDQTFGKWQSFTFLDPTDNVLLYSEDLKQPVWTTDPLLAVSPGQDDPKGGSGAIRLINSAQTTQHIVQKQAVPGNYQYCLSVFLQSPQPTNVELLAISGGQEQATTAIANASWGRAVLPFQFASEGDGLSVGIRMAAGQMVSVFGLQLEAQPGAGLYKKTRDRGGVHPNCRFDQDILQWNATSMNQFACQVKLVSNVAG